jgi:hypothetical protein
MNRATADAVTIRDLKRRYKMGLAVGATLPTHDIPISLPLSTGNPLFDAALTDKLVATATLSEAEHLNRGWKLVQGATTGERDALARNARLLLNDYKLLLALRAWQEGDEAQTRTFLRALPWAWRLGFPTAVIKPAAQIFTGWRRSLRFRLVDDPRYGPLHELYREILAQAPPVTLLKYCCTTASRGTGSALSMTGATATEPMPQPSATWNPLEPTCAPAAPWPPRVRTLFWRC